MKELEQLKEQAFSLNTTAKKLQGVMEVISESSQKMEEVAELINASSKIQVSGAKETTDGVFVSKMDAAVLMSLREASADYRKVNEQLSTVLGELVKMLDLDGSGVDVYLLQYVADAMETFRGLIELVNDIEYTD